MQIHHLLVTENQIDGIDVGRELCFGQSVTILEEGDAVVARLLDGREQLMLVRRLTATGFVCELNADGAKCEVALETVTPRMLRVL